MTNLLSTKDKWETMRDDYLERRAQTLENALSFCESPIEKLLLMTFVETFFGWFQTDHSFTFVFFPVRLKDPKRISLVGQHEIRVEDSAYRLDFALFYPRRDRRGDRR